MNLDSWETIVYTCIFLLPGFLIKEVIDSIVPPKFHNDVKFFFTCIIYSILNLALWAWLDKIVYTNCKNENTVFLYLALINLGTSLFAGFIIGFIKYYNFPFNILRIKKLNNPIPTAWDYYFNKKEPCFVVITLKSGKSIYGLFSDKSFASSEQAERDLYIEKTYNFNDETEWKEIPRNKGIYINKEDIETIEFYSIGGNENE